MATNRSAALMQIWMQRGPLAWLLWPVSLLFGLLLKIRMLCYRCGWLQQQRLPVPVIVVGNIFVGGTGKTPLTIWLLQQLQQRGYRPGVVSRGYGSKQGAPRVVNADSDAGQGGDEPILIAQHTGCPVMVGRSRVAAGRALLAQFPEVDVIVSDDGLQHYAMQRDIELMLFDARGAGNRWLFPAGPLREPISRRRDFTIVNLGAGQVVPTELPADAIRMQLVGNQATRLMDSEQSMALAALSTDLQIVAAAGIGSPERFFAMLRAQGVQFSALPLPDHFDYQTNPFAQFSADMILITEKDAVKCRQSHDIAADPRIWVVPVTADIDSSLVDAILKKMKLERRTT